MLYTTSYEPRCSAGSESTMNISVSTPPEPLLSVIYSMLFYSSAVDTACSTDVAPTYTFTSQVSVFLPSGILAVPPPPRLLYMGWVGVGW